jgi:ubiquinone/menaquinone biosynthesis C-methylase UbiE
MLQRILEPEVMDSAEEARDYDAMDHSAVNRAFVADFILAWDGRSPVLDVGTGTAQIPVELCRRYPSAEVVAVDLSSEMLVVARENVQKARLESRIQVESQNGRQMTYADGMFPAVMSNSILHHIPEPADAIAEMVRVAAVGGLLFVRDLIRPPDGAMLDHIVNTYAGNANLHQRKMFAESLHAAMTVDEVQALVARFGFGSRSVRATSDRHWTWCAIKRA